MRIKKMKEEVEATESFNFIVNSVEAKIPLVYGVGLF